MRARLLFAILAILATPVSAQPPGGPPPTVAAAVGAEEAVIPPGMEALFGAMLGGAEALPGGCKLSDGQIDRTTVRGTYDCPGGKVVLELVHPGAAPSGSVATQQFALAVASGNPPPGFVDTVAARVRAREGEFTWKVVSGGSSGGGGARNMRSVLLTAAVVVIGLLLALAAIRAVLRLRRGGRSDAT